MAPIPYGGLCQGGRFELRLWFRNIGFGIVRNPYCQDSINPRPLRRKLLVVLPLLGLLYLKCGFDASDLVGEGFFRVGIAHPTSVGFLQVIRTIKTRKRNDPGAKPSAFPVSLADALFDYNWRTEG